MAKIASVRHFWTKSPSADVTKVVAVLTINGNETRTEYGPEVEEFVTDVNAGSSVSYLIETYDGEGKVATSETYTYNLGDLVDPLPATLLGHEVVGVRDEEPNPPVQTRKTR